MNKALNKHCNYCNKTIKYQSNWIKHTKTKKHLRNIENSTQSHTNSTQITHNPTQITHKVEKVYECEYCSKSFNRKDSKKRHIKKYCKDKIEIDRIEKEKKETEKEKDDLIEKLMGIVKNQKGDITNNITNNNNTLNDNKTINQTININVHGKEDHAGIIDSDLFYKLGGMEGLKMLKLYLDEVFVNKEENNNIKYSNLRSNKCRTLQHRGDNKKWCVDKIDNVIDTRIKTSPMKLNKMIRAHLNETIYEDPEDKKIDDQSRQKIYQTLSRITKMVYQNTRPDLVEKEKITPKEKQGYRDLYEDHKMTLYNNTY